MGGLHATLYPSDVYAGLEFIAIVVLFVTRNGAVF